LFSGITTGMTSNRTKKTSQRPIPRTPSDGSAEGLLLVLVCCWIFGSLLVFFFAAVTVLPGWYHYFRLSQQGELAAGRLVRQDEGRNWSVYLYRFQACSAPGRDAGTFAGQQSVRSDEFTPLSPESPVVIRYLADDPTISVIEQYFRSPSWGTLWYFGIALVLLVGGLVALPGRWQAWHIVYRLNTKGQAVPARIINRWRIVDSKNNDLYCVAYQFVVTDVDAAYPHTIIAAEYNYVAYRKLSIGDTSPIKYLPDRPDFCFLEMNALLLGV
jgi:hypothetical protein